MPKGFWKGIRPKFRAQDEGKKAPAMINEIIHVMSLQSMENQMVVDATFGSGGHARYLKKHFDIGLVGVDADFVGYEHRRGLAHRYRSPPSFAWSQGTWSNLRLAVLQASKEFYDPVESCDVVLFDLGLNLDQMYLPERGFLARQAGPLDMRLCRTVDSLTADMVIHEFDEPLLKQIFSLYGGESEDLSAEFARAIVSQRKEKPFRTTVELSKFLCEEVVQENHVQSCAVGPHPAEKAFLGLRTFCCNYYEEMALGFREAERLLSPGGLLIIAAFQEMETRVIQEFEETRTEGPKASFEKVFPDPLRCQDQDLRKNPRNKYGLVFAYRRTDLQQIEDEMISTEYLLSFQQHPAYLNGVLKNSSVPGRF